MSKTTAVTTTADMNLFDSAASLEAEGHNRRWATWVEKGVRENRQAERRVQVFAAIVITAVAAAVLFMLW